MLTWSLSTTDIMIHLTVLCVKNYFIIFLDIFHQAPVKLDFSIKVFYIIPQNPPIRAVFARKIIRYDGICRTLQGKTSNLVRHTAMIIFILFYFKFMLIAPYLLASTSIVSVSLVLTPSV